MADRASNGARESKKQESRSAVLGAAATLFARHGYEGVAIADVAALSGVRKPNLLYHFESKESLWKATVDWVFAEVDAFFETRRTDLVDMADASRKHRWDAFKQYVAAYYEACRRFPAYVLIPLIEGVAPSWRTDWIAERHLKRHVANFGRFAQGLIDEQLLPQVEPLHLQNMLTGGALRWSRLFGQFGGEVKLILGFDHAASRSVSVGGASPANDRIPLFL